MVPAACGTALPVNMKSPELVIESENLLYPLQEKYNVPQLKKLIFCSSFTIIDQQLVNQQCVK